VDRCSPVVADDNRGLFLKSRHWTADEQSRCSVGFHYQSMVITISGVDRCSPVVADDNRGLFLKSRHLMADEQIRCSVGFYVSKHGNKRGILHTESWKLIFGVLGVHCVCVFLRIKRSIENIHTREICQKAEKGLCLGKGLPTEF